MNATLQEQTWRWHCWLHWLYLSVERRSRASWGCMPGRSRLQTPGWSNSSSSSCWLRIWACLHLEWPTSQSSISSCSCSSVSMSILLIVPRYHCPFTWFGLLIQSSYRALMITVPSDSFFGCWAKTCCCLLDHLWHHRRRSATISAEFWFVSTQLTSALIICPYLDLIVLFGKILELAFQSQLHWSLACLQAWKLAYFFQYFFQLNRIRLLQECLLTSSICNWISSDSWL